MKLLTKFSLILLLVFGLGLCAAGYLSYDMLQRRAHVQVLYQAQLMMDSAGSIRHYTTDQIKPLLEGEVARDVFRPQTVPAFAATEIFGDLRKNYPDYSYKEATLNPTNPRDRAADWESDIINTFRNRPESDKSLLNGERTTPTGKSLFLAGPLRAAGTCMECHSTPDVAPKAMTKLYGTANGFGWKENEVIGAQIVSVPEALPEEMANSSFKQFMISLGSLGVAMLVVVNVMLYYSVIRPVRRLSASANRVSQGAIDEPELQMRGSDEISVLAGAFNRMHRSVASAMKMLERK